jgi:hypothetical protein
MDRIYFRCTGRPGSTRMVRARLSGTLSGGCATRAGGLSVPARAGFLGVRTYEGNEPPGVPRRLLASPCQRPAPAGGKDPGGGNR